MSFPEIKNEILQDYKSVFEMVRTMVVEENKKNTNFRLRIFKVYETYINNLDENGYESDDAVFTGYLYKLETPIFFLVNRSGPRKGTDFKRF